MTRTADDLTQEERKRIVAGCPHAQPDWEDDTGRYISIVSTLFDISEDTVRQVLREEGE